MVLLLCLCAPFVLDLSTYCLTTKLTVIIIMTMLAGDLSPAVESVHENNNSEFTQHEHPVGPRSLLVQKDA